MISIFDIDKEEFIIWNWTLCYIFYTQCAKTIRNFGIRILQSIIIHFLCAIFLPLEINVCRPYGHPSSEFDVLSQTVLIYMATHLFFCFSLLMICFDELGQIPQITLRHVLIDYFYSKALDSYHIAQILVELRDLKIKSRKIQILKNRSNLPNPITDLIYDMAFKNDKVDFQSKISICFHILFFVIFNVIIICFVSLIISNGGQYMGIFLLQMRDNNHSEIYHEANDIDGYWLLLLF